MTGVIEGFRWALTEQGRPPDLGILASAGMVLVMFFGGLIYFNKMKSTIADVV
jgi:ABC-type polysaccharide/polyol phosphate export permease